MIQLPELYSKHLKKQFSHPQYLMLLIVINLLQDLQTVRLEELARRFPVPIQLRNRSQWRTINLLMVSIVYDNRAIPVDFFLLPKKGNSNLAQQKQVLEPALSLLQDYKIIVLGNREFCGVELARWLSQEQKAYLSLRLKKNEYVELEEQIWFQLTELGLEPGMSCYYQGIRVTKTKGFSGFNLAAKYKRNYRDKSSKEPWYILTNLDSLATATVAYSKRMGIEEMFRDLKLGGYNLEVTQVTSHRLISLILLVTIAYSISILSGQYIKQKGVAKYVSRPTEPNRFYRRHSSFSIGLYAQNWLESNTFFQDLVQELIGFSTDKNDYYRQGMRAKTLIQQAF